MTHEKISLTKGKLIKPQRAIDLKKIKKFVLVNKSANLSINEECKQLLDLDKNLNDG